MNPDKEKINNKADLQLSGTPEYFGVKSPVIRAIAKYKKTHKTDPDITKNLKYGDWCVVQSIAKYKRGKGFNDVEGYYLCRIIDWTEESGWWAVNTMVFLVIIESSFAEGDSMVGRIINGRYGNHGLWGQDNRIIEFGKSQFPKRRI